ncbi:MULTISPECIES: GGDEF domain-containing protein [Sulfurimonas]|uniref:GGDEF domain-containing protein n=1 Tax=Sulfurimonas TaxID=202746 RepID=UPI001265673E|nr:GGDEF domain-containing protein [Sulfurimonas indica]
MQNSENLLQIVTNDTRDSILNMDIVTPSIYASVFSKYADDHDLSLENEDEISREILQKECSFLTELQSQTSKNANILSETTTKAITAMRDKNETLLQDVLKETEALRQEVEKLKESVYRDELTHTYNRKWLHDNYIDDEKRFTKNGLLAIIDLNYFKLINDTYGHIIGDKVLIFMANHLKSIERDIVRYGGDEFIILFPESTHENLATKRLHKTRESILAKKLKAHEEMFTLSFSFGLASFQQNDSLAEIIENADKNMYNDKVKIKSRITGI